MVMAGRWRPLRTMRALERAFGRAKTSRDYKRKVERQLRVLRATLPADAFDFDAAETKAFLAARFPGYGDLRWHRFYAAATGRHAGTYLPEDVFYFHVLPVLNPPERWHAYLDKNLTPALGLAPMPRVVARVVRGRLVDAERRTSSLREALERAQGASAVVMKPARDSGSGRGVRRVDTAALEEALTSVLRPDGGDWLVEEVVVVAKFVVVDLLVIILRFAVASGPVLNVPAHLLGDPVQSVILGFQFGVEFLITLQ